ncbi:MAG TPA: hypothetical protein VH113_09575 [Gemmatimonadales bacterium]|nr:hypothetical protein [Gemmatimonadales bacterium]
MKIRAVALAALFAAACSSPFGVDPVGDWGGTRAHLDLRLSGGTVQYECGMGTIDSGWAENPDGSWLATGQHYLGGGPASDTSHSPHPALYSGRFTGDRLNFRVFVPDLGDTLGPFSLVRNGPGVSEICV